MGKMLLLSFENSEDDVISEILSILENKQMKICENKNIKKCLEFQGLTINAERRLAVKGNKEIEFIFTEFFFLIPVLLIQHASWNVALFRDTEIAANFLILGFSGKLKTELQ